MVAATPTARSDAAHIAAEIGAILAGGAIAREAVAFRRFLQLADNLAAAHGAGRIGLTLTEPAPTGSPNWDAAIAAVCEQRLNAESLPIPGWINARAGDSSAFWAPRTSAYDIPADSAQVPPEFFRRGILIEAATLESH
jgi:hypothetical protein